MATNTLLDALTAEELEHDKYRYKINILARMLAGYDEKTWNKLRRDRKLTYIRAAQTLDADWDIFVDQMKRFS
jgi:hypothetical protein